VGLESLRYNCRIRFTVREPHQIQGTIEGGPGVSEKAVPVTCVRDWVAKFTSSWFKLNFRISSAVESTIIHAKTTALSDAAGFSLLK